MSDIFEQMIAQHTIAGDNDRKNALYEVMQQVVLSGLYPLLRRTSVLLARWNQLS